VRAVAMMIDWDDTLFPTTAATAGQVTPAQWVLLRDTLKRFLTVAMRFAHVYIVTNSEQGWAQLCIDKYLPEIADFMTRVPVISARTAYERRDVAGPSVAEQTRWKFLAMLDILRRETLRTRTLPVLVQIGDSMVEHDALKRIAGLFPGLPPVKSIKFADHPSPDIIVRELDDLIPVIPTLARLPKTAVGAALA
jgi:hypothetical protein